MTPSDTNFDRAFVSIMFALFALFAIGIFIDPHGSQSLIFFRGTDDFFADYFNPAKMSSDLNPYWFGLDDPEPHEHAYPPLNYVVFYLLSRFADYGNLDAFSAGLSYSGMASALIVATLAVVVIYILLQRAYGKHGVLGSLLPLSMLLSSVFLFSIERGNIMMLCVACAYFFVIAYRSENRIVSELALVCLAVATALRGYPALFGMLLLFDRRYAASARCALYAIALIFLPFLLFEGGFGNIAVWLHNITLNSQVYGGQSNSTSFGFRVFARAVAFVAGDSAGNAMLASVLDALCKVVCIAGLVFCVFLKGAHWKRVVLLGTVIVCLQTNSAEYLGLYLFVGIALFFAEEEHGPTDWVFLALVILFLNPFQVELFGVNLTSRLMGISVDVMLIWLVAEAIGSAVGKFRDKSVAVANSGR